MSRYSAYFEADGFQGCLDTNHRASTTDLPFFQLVLSQKPKRNSLIWQRLWNQRCVRAIEADLYY